MSQYVMRMVLWGVLSCLGILSLPAYTQSPPPLLDPVWKQAIEQLIAAYIRSYPEVIEQSLQALEAKRQEAERLRVKQAIGAHQHELLYDPASPVSGDPTAEVTVIEFFDYRCGFCKAVVDVVRQVQHDDARVRIVSRRYAECLNAFLAARVLFMVSWILHWPQPDHIAWGPSYVQQAVGRLRRLLER